jgi:hypothetical protein
LHETPKSHISTTLTKIRTVHFPAPEIDRRTFAIGSCARRRDTPPPETEAPNLRRIHRPTHFGGSERHRSIIVKTNVFSISILR